MSVEQFPTEEARRATARERLARYLRELADLIETDEVVTEPVAALIVLTGAKQHEAIHVGYRGMADAVREAAEVARAVLMPWRTRGGNIRQRYSYTPRVLRDDNVVDGAFPSSRKGKSDAQDDA